VPSRGERVEGLAVAEENRPLVVLDDELGAELDVGGAGGRLPVDDLRAGRIEVLDQLE
jgi:hypothetical protein